MARSMRALLLLVGGFIAFFYCNPSFSESKVSYIGFLGDRVSFGYESKWTRDGEGVDSYIVDTSGRHRIHVDFYEAEGGVTPEIKHVFVSGKMRKKLFVIVAWGGDVSALGTGGSVYQVFAYDEVIEQKKGIPTLRRDAELVKRFGIGFDGTREGERLTYKYKTMASVERQLLEWDYQ